MANRMDKDFVLLSLTPSELDRDLLDVFRPLVRQSDRRTYRHSPWEEVRSFIYQNLPVQQERQQVVKYLDEKTAGYIGGRLQKAFCCGE